MYSTCLFCNGALGVNESIEQFPVGRRLAFDAAKGRLWVVCRHCERWNLTPLEERWEAIESCERAFRETKLRVSTDEIGLARLRDGLELVRIGAPQRPEMAAWRYGDQFGRRRRRSLLIGGGVAVAVVGYVVAGPILGVVTTIGLGGTGVVNIFNFGRSIYRTRAVAARLPVGGNRQLIVQRDHLDRASLRWNSSERSWSLDITHRRGTTSAEPWWHLDNQREETNLSGDEAIQAARLLLPRVNALGAGRKLVSEAVGLLELTPEPAKLFSGAARNFAKTKSGEEGARVVLSAIPRSVRLALEMAAHEDTERRALEGELHLLESAWRDAEEIAAIADDMFLPDSVDADLARLKRRGS